MYCIHQRPFYFKEEAIVLRRNDEALNTADKGVHVSEQEKTFFATLARAPIVPDFGASRLGTQLVNTSLLPHQLLSLAVFSHGYPF